MAHLFLSGGAYGADWLPLISPLVCVVLLLYAGDLTIKYYRKWRLHRENKVVKDLTGIEPEGTETHSES